MKQAWLRASILAGIALVATFAQAAPLRVEFFVSGMS